MPVVKGQCARDVLPHFFNISVFKSGEKISSTIRHIYNESVNLFDSSNAVLTPMIGVISHKQCQWLAWRVWWHMLTFVTRDYLMPSICSLLWKNLCHCPPKSTQSCYNLLSKLPCDIHLIAISQELFINLICNIFSEITLLKLPPFLPGPNELTHWGWVMHICISKLTIIGSDIGLSPGWCQAIIWTNARIWLIGPLGTNFIEMLIEIQAFSLKKICLTMQSMKCCPFCLNLNSLVQNQIW